MPKKKTTRVERQRTMLDNTMFVIIALGVIFGFVAGYLFTKNRYIQRVDQISTMNMEKAETINQLRDQLKVLGASTEK
jgi:hypothetical protein